MALLICTLEYTTGGGDFGPVQSFVNIHLFIGLKTLETVMEIIGWYKLAMIKFSTTKK